MPRNDSKQGTGAAQVEESAALERKERSAVRSDQPHYTRGQVKSRYFRRATSID